jgi:DNA-binding transcriptional LysR family regulator
MIFTYISKINCFNNIIDYTNAMGITSLGLDAFFACAIEQNFTRAATKLHMTQSALSQRIKNLEYELGHTLFIRDKSGVILTEKGKILLRYCQTKNQMESELLSDFQMQKGQISGEIKVGCYSSVSQTIVLPTFKNLSERFDKVAFQLIVKELYELPSILMNATVDFILLDHQLNKEGISSILLGHEVYVRIRKKGSPNSNIFLDHDEEDMTTLHYLKKKKGAKLNRHYFDDINTIIKGVELGLGDSIVPKSLISHLKNIEIINPEIEMKYPIYLHFFEQNFRPQLHTIFLETIRELNTI